MSRQTIATDGIAPTVGPISTAVRAGGFLFLSGQIALDPISGKLVTGDVRVQTEQVFRNIGAVLDAAQRSFADVVRITVYLADIKDYNAMNAIYARYFEPPFPARTTIAVAALPFGAVVEIEALLDCA